MGPVKIKGNQRDSMIAPAVHGIQTKKFPPTPMNRLPEANLSAQPLIWRQVGDWRVRMKTPAGERHDFDLAPPQEVRVQDELAPDGLPESKEKTDGWLRGLALCGVRAEECTIPGALLPASFVVKSAPGRAETVLIPGRPSVFYGNLHGTSVWPWPMRRVGLAGFGGRGFPISR